MRWIFLGVGVCVMLAGAAILAVPWFDAARWQGSPEAGRAVRNAEAPTVVVITPTPAVEAGAPAPTYAPTLAPQLSTPITLAAHIDVAPSPTPSTSDLVLGESAFVFDDPPEPGAHAHLTVSIRNPTDSASPSISLTLPTSWLAGYRLETLDPGPIDGAQADGALRLTFNGPPPQSNLELRLGFITTDEVIDPPTATVFDDKGRSVGVAHPATQAPKPRPGPIYSIDIPRLKLHSAVVPVEWEPPLFVVGELRSSAYVSEGNSVLVGHVRGAAGYNIFDHLDQLEVGDQVIANSRGAAYNFIVTEKDVMAEDDTSPTDSTASPRLTLMTCTGDWNPLTRDYSDRLWVVAEPENTARPARGAD